MVQAEALSTHSSRVAAIVAIRNQIFFIVFIFVLPSCAEPPLALRNARFCVMSLLYINIHKYQE